MSSTPAAVTTILDVANDRTRALVERRRRGGVQHRGELVRRALLLADACGLLAAFMLAQALFGGSGSRGHVGPSTETLIFFASLPVWVVAARAYGLYDHDEERTDHSTVEELVGVFHLITVGSWLLYVIAAFTQVASPTLARDLSFWAFGIVGVSVLRVIARTLCRRSSAYVQNTVIVGSGHIGQLVARKVLQHREYGLNLVGFVDRPSRRRREGLEHVAVLGGVEQLHDVVEQLEVDRVIFAFADTPSKDLVALVRELRDRHVQIDIVPRMFELAGPALEVHDIEGLPLIAIRSRRPDRSSLLVKRVVDIGVAGLMLLLLSPVFVWIAWRIHRDSPGPTFFRQTRLGYGQREFTLLKFRTMAVDTDPSATRSTADARSPVTWRQRRVASSSWNSPTR